MNVQIHEKSKIKMKDIIRKILKTSDLVITGRTGHFDFSLYEALATELNKRKIGFKIDKLSCWIIFDGMKRVHFKDKSLGDVRVVDEFVDSLYDVYTNTPMNYSIDFHFRNLKIDIEQIEYDFIAIRSANEVGLGLIGKQEKYAVVSIKRDGYFSGGYPGSFFKEILQDLKVFVFLLKSANLIKVGKRDVSSSLFLSMTGYKDNIQIECINNKYDWMNCNSSVSESINKFLYNLVLNTDIEKEEINKKINNSLLVLNALVKNNTKEALRIRAAIGWLVQSEINDDETMSFVQICMGLESIFGDDDYEGGLTTILSDRCAYLIGKNIKDRRFIKDTFKKIYQIRSKIVHGVRNHLSEDEEHLRHLADFYLEKSILKEIKNLDL